MSLHKQSSALADILLSAIKPIKKKEPSTILITLKKKSPFFLGSLVTKRSEIRHNLLKEKYAAASIHPVSRILVPKLVPICSKEN